MVNDKNVHLISNLKLSSYRFQLLILAMSFSTRLNRSSVPAIFSLWESLSSLINSLLSFLFYKLNRLISFNCKALSLVFNSFSGSPDFQHAFKNAHDRSHSGMKYHSRQYYTQRYYMCLCPPTLYSLSFASKDLIIYTPISFIASALEAFFQVLTYLLWLLSLFRDPCFPKFMFLFCRYGLHWLFSKVNFRGGTYYFVWVGQDCMSLALC